MSILTYVDGRYFMSPEMNDQGIQIKPNNKLSDISTRRLSTTLSSYPTIPTIGLEEIRNKSDKLVYEYPYCS